jgi:hypothetical protein
MRGQNTRENGGREFSHSTLLRDRKVQVQMKFRCLRTPRGGKKATQCVLHRWLNCLTLVRRKFRKTEYPNEQSACLLLRASLQALL